MGKFKLFRAEWVEKPLCLIYGYSTGGKATAPEIPRDPGPLPVPTVSGMYADISPPPQCHYEARSAVLSGFLSPLCNFTLPPPFGPCRRFRPHFHKTHVKSRYAIYSCNSLQFHIPPGSPFFKCNVSGCIVVLFCKLDGSILQKSQGCISAVDSICNIAHI